jgi:hypothetical protein
MIVVLNKSDLGLAIDRGDRMLGLEGLQHVALSAKTGEGMDSLETLLGEVGVKLTKGLCGESRTSLNERALILVETASMPLSNLPSFGRGERLSLKCVRGVAKGFGFSGGDHRRAGGRRDPGPECTNDSALE